MAHYQNLDVLGEPQTRKWDEALYDEYGGDPDILWDNYGIDDDIIVCIIFPFCNNWLTYKL